MDKYFRTVEEDQKPGQCNNTYQVERTYLTLEDIRGYVT